MKRLGLIIVSVAALVATLVLSSGGSAQAPDGRTLTFFADASHETGSLIDEFPKSPSNDPASKRFRLSAGDRLVRTTPLLDKKGGKRIGTEYADVVVVKGTGFENATYLGHAVVQLADGQLVAAFAFKPARTNSFAVIGGTGAYEGARGIATEVDEGNGGDATVRLLP